MQPWRRIWQLYSSQPIWYQRNSTTSFVPCFSKFISILTYGLRPSIWATYSTISYALQYFKITFLSLNSFKNHSNTHAFELSRASVSPIFDHTSQIITSLHPLCLYRIPLQSSGLLVRRLSHKQDHTFSTPSLIRLSPLLAP